MIRTRESRKSAELIRVIRESTNLVLAAQKHGVLFGWLIYRCETSKEPHYEKRCFKSQKYGHSVNKCNNEQHCLRCSGQHTVKQCPEPKEKSKFANCSKLHASVYKECSSYQNAVVEATKRKQETIKLNCHGDKHKRSGC